MTEPSSASKIAIILPALAIASVPGCDRPPPPRTLDEIELVEVATVGAIDGDSAQMFGRIVDVRATSNGSFVVLDQQFATLGWYDDTGNYLGGVRNRGSGPGELMQPTALDVSGTDDITVADPPNGRYAGYALTEGRVTPIGALPVISPGASGKHICSLGSRLYLRAVRENRRIHEVDGDGTILRSFEPVDSASSAEFGPAAAMVAAQRNGGHLRCLEEPGLLLSLSMYVPTLRAYSPDGELVWERELADLRPMRFVAIPEGGVRFEGDPELGSHVAETIIPWTDRSVLVQHAVLWPQGVAPEERDRDHYSLESREISLADGGAMAWSDRLPLISDANGPILHSFANMPYPRVRILRRAE